MPERPTHKFTTSGGHTLVLKDYITGNENWQIRQVYLRGMKSNAEAADTSLEAEKKGIELVVLSFDASTEGIADRVLDLPVAEYREVMDELSPIIDGKKKSETS